jgi:hypothetical protein
MSTLFRLAAGVWTLVAGERPSYLTDEESIAHDMAAVLNRGHQVPNTTYDPAVR